MTGFWKTLPRPFFALAPMADVTDAAFRRIIARYGKPDVIWTEFVSADGLCLGGREKLERDLIFTDAERPIVAQLFTARPEMMEKAAALARELGFDGVDINMGCPDRSIERAGAGAALMKDASLSRELIEAAQAGARELPVSVKTRLGYNKDEVEEWIPALLSAKPAALIVHARTRKELSKVPARWERIARVVELRDALEAPTLIVGNGDAIDLADAREKAGASGADGVMLGRAIFGNPWLFAGTPFAEVPTAERLRVMVEHTKLFEELFGGVKNFAVMKKHYKAYVHGWPACPARAGRDGAKKLRARLMEAKDAREVERIVSGLS